MSFEYTIAEYAHLPWLMAAIAARFFIGLEAGLGALLVFNIYGKHKWIIKTAISLLLLFSVYLVYLWITAGNKINCGCFGDTIWMNPSTSLLKNILMIAILLLIYKNYSGIRFKWAKILSPIILIIFVILPYILFAIPDQQPTWLRKDKFKLSLTSLYNPQSANPVPAIDLQKGKYILGFFSLSCPHCRMAAHKMHIMKEKNPALPFYFVVAGKDKYIKPFWDETKAIDIPHTKLDADSFTNLVGYSWPVIYWLNNDSVEAQTNYVQLNQGEIEKWLEKK
jgi:hypothetical protein